MESPLDAWTALGLRRPPAHAGRRRSQRAHHRGHTRRGSSTRQRRKERLRQVLVGATLAALLVTSLAFVAGAGGKAHYAGIERDPMHEQLTAQLTQAEAELRRLEELVLATRLERSPRATCIARHVELAGALLDQQRAGLGSFERASHDGHTIVRLRAADGLRETFARFTATTEEAAGCR